MSRPEIIIDFTVYMPDTWLWQTFFDIIDLTAIWRAMHA